MESFDIADKIIEFLSSNHDKFYSIHQIHAELYEKHEEFRRLDMKKDMINRLKTTFLTIEGEYNNIYRIVKNDKHYLIWSLRSKEEIIKEVIPVDEIKSYPIQSEIEKDLDNFLSFSSQNDYVSLIKEYIMKKDMSFMFDNNLIDGNNYPIHVLIQNNEFELIKKLDELTNVDYSKTNSKGKNCIDLARESRNCEILEFILDKIFYVKLTQVNKLVENLKEGQKTNYDKISVLNKKIDELSKKNKELEENNAFNFLKNIIIIVLLYFAFK